MEPFLTDPILALVFGGTTLAILCAALMWVASNETDGDL